MRTGLVPGVARSPLAADGLGRVQDVVLEQGKQDAAARATASGWTDQGPGAGPG